MKKIKNAKFSKVSLITLMILGLQFGPLGLTGAWALGIPFAVEGQVNLDSVPANGAAVVLTDTNTGAFLTDTVGPTGASETSVSFAFGIGRPVASSTVPPTEPVTCA